MTHNENVIAYVETIYDFIQGKTEEEIRRIVKEDISQMEKELADYTLLHFEEIIEECLAEKEDHDKFRRNLNLAHDKNGLFAYYD